MAATYTVQTGDSWEKIAGKVYGNQRMFLELAKANQGIYNLAPGMVLDLPPAYEDPFVSNEAAVAQGMTPATAFNEKGELKTGWAKTEKGYVFGGATSGLSLPSLTDTYRNPPSQASPLGLTLSSLTTVPKTPTITTPTGTTPPKMWRWPDELEQARLESFKNYQTNPTKYNLPPRISQYTLEQEYNPESIIANLPSFGYQKVGSDWVLSGSLGVTDTGMGYSVPPTPFTGEWYQMFSAGLQVPPPYYYSPYAEVVQIGNNYALVPFGQGGDMTEGNATSVSVTGRSDMYGMLEGLFTVRYGN
jgi:hypothetical protein